MSPVSQTRNLPAISLLTVLCAVFFGVNEGADKKTAAAPPPMPLDRLVYPDEKIFNNFYSGVDLHSNQQHVHPEGEGEDYDDGVGGKPGDPTGYGGNSSKENSNQIPLNLIKEINDKGYTVNDLLLHYLDDYNDSSGFDLENRFAGEKANVRTATEAKCMPELRTVNLIENKDPLTLYIPTCTRIERCGGCCMHDLLECQPMEVETVNLQVYRGSYKGGKNFKFDGKEIVTLDRHKSCKCGCKIQEKDCNAMQMYEKEKCQCTCRNKDEEKKCYKENSTKLWNPSACACQCREASMCTTGSVFDWRQCKCVVKQVRRRNADQQGRTGYRSGALPVIPFGMFNNN